MSGSAFETILIKDDRIGCITPQVKFGCMKSGQNVTAMPFKAISQSNSAHVIKRAGSKSGDGYQQGSVVAKHGYFEDNAEHCQITR